MAAAKLPVILASTSPRRIDLLTQAGLRPLIVAPDIDETMIPRENPGAMVARLAREKAEVVAARLLSGGLSEMRPGPAIIIAADTTVVAPGGKQVLGKPENTADAHRMLKLLSGDVHTVLTGYCILKLSAPKRKGGPFESHILVRVVTSKVRMRELSKRDIENYVRTGEPNDKAGAYGAQGIGMSLIESLDGSYSNVIGLPICQVMQDLEAKFGVGLFENGHTPKKAGKKATSRRSSK